MNHNTSHDMKDMIRTSLNFKRSTLNFKRSSLNFISTLLMMGVNEIIL